MFETFRAGADELVAPPLVGKLVGSDKVGQVDIVLGLEDTGR